MIINISNHKLSNEQRANQEVLNMPDIIKELWGAITPDEVNRTVAVVDAWVHSNTYNTKEKVYVHIAGQGSALSKALNKMTTLVNGEDEPITLMYAYSTRESEEHTNAEGEVIKTSKFVFKGWYDYANDTKIDI